LASACLSGTIFDFYSVDKLPVFMVATPTLAKEHPDTLVAYRKAWLDVGKDFRTEPDKVADAIYGFYSSKGSKLSRETLRKARAGIKVNPGFPPENELKPYMDRHADELLKANKI
jgi:ABC-type nitrate/sulfonate/bicarbonate transport system substrate-binding protein